MGFFDFLTIAMAIMLVAMIVDKIYENKKEER